MRSGGIFKHSCCDLQGVGEVEGDYLLVVCPPELRGQEGAKGEEKVGEELRPLVVTASHGDVGVLEGASRGAYCIGCLVQEVGSTLTGATKV